MTIDELIYQELENCGRKKTDVATDMGKPLSTLSRETSPWDDKAKFGLADLVPFMKATGSVEPLRFIAQAMGYQIMPLTVTPDKADVRDEMLDDNKAEQNFHEAIRRKDPPLVVEHALEEAKTELTQTAVKYRQDYDQARGWK